MRRMIVMLTTALLLGSASIAAAECAWVLWHHTNQVGWTLKGARPSYKECEVYLRILIRELHRRELAEMEYDYQVESFIREHMKSFAKPREGHVCLPDTIDPREK